MRLPQPGKVAEIFITPWKEAGLSRVANGHLPMPKKTLASFYSPFQKVVVEIQNLISSLAGDRSLKSGTFLGGQFWHIVPLGSGPGNAASLLGVLGGLRSCLRALLAWGVPIKELQEEQLRTGLRNADKKQFSLSISKKRGGNVNIVSEIFGVAFFLQLL